jgi:hypothetical protein
MSNAKYRPADVPAKPKDAATPHLFDPVIRCQRDEKLFALYLEIGGVLVDASIRFLHKLIEGGRRSVEIGFASEHEEWVKHEKDPAYKPRRLRPAVSVSEALRAVHELGSAMDQRHELMARACELAALGHQATAEFLAQAHAAFAAQREKRTHMVMSQDAFEPAAQAQSLENDVAAVRESHAASVAA